MKYDLLNLLARNNFYPVSENDLAKMKNSLQYALSEEIENAFYFGDENHHQLLLSKTKVAITFNNQALVLIFKRDGSLLRAAIREHIKASKEANDKLDVSGFDLVMFALTNTHEYADEGGINDFIELCNTETGNWLRERHNEAEMAEKGHAGHQMDKQDARR